MKQLRVSGVTAKHAIDHGLTDRQADTWAIRLGYHPIEIWPTYCDQKEQHDPRRNTPSIKEPKVLAEP